MAYDSTSKLVKCHNSDMGDALKMTFSSVLVQLFRRSSRRALFLASPEDFDRTIYPYSPASQNSKHNLHAYFPQTKTSVACPVKTKETRNFLRAPLSSY